MKKILFILCTVLLIISVKAEILHVLLPPVHNTWPDSPRFVMFAPNISPINLGYGLLFAPTPTVILSPIQAIDLPLK